VSNGWAGLENLSLIPGTVGASPIQNIGAYGVEVKDVIDSVQVIEIDSGKQRRLSNADCRFGYRDSIFKQTLKGKVIVLNVTFKLIKTSFPDQGLSSSATQPFKVFSLLKLDYGDLRAELQQKNITDPTISDVRDAVCDIRCRKLPDPAEIGNAGSFFKNPMVTEEQAGILSRNFPGMPVHMKQAATNLVKIPAAWLIDQCGWKGYRNGDAGVHVNQPLVLVNYGNATGQQILDLSGKIIASVVSKFGITLEMEVNVV
jgi:UDP-N-acetylmuramate dehydrogenase